MQLLTPTPPAQPQLTSLERNSIRVQHKGDFEDMFAIALQVSLRAVKIRQLSFNACHSQKTSAVSSYCWQNSLAKPPTGRQVIPETSGSSGGP